MTPRGAEHYRDILHQLRLGLERIYGPRLKDLILYGSYARGEADAGSDVDVLLVLDDFADDFAEIERTLDLVAGLSLEHNTVISLVPVRDQEWRERRSSFLMNVGREGVRME